MFVIVVLNETLTQEHLGCLVRGKSWFESYQIIITD